MGKKLVVVESPTKARTIGRFLGPSVQVQASMGHIRDLPEKSLGVDVNNDFAPSYELTPSGRKIVRTLRQAAASADDIYLATDHDREGEAIAWHLQEILQDAGKANFHRITFHEITRNAIQKSFANPGVIAEDLVAAQQARRVLDRLVGYQVSPLLWRHVKKGTSAGRVQSVALRIVVEREREILAFEPQEYWNLDAWFENREQKAKLKTRLARINDLKALVSNGADAERLADALQSPQVAHQVVKVQSTPRRKNAPPPFITSTLQQAAGSALKMGAAQTMRVAQQLYEGIELGSGGPVGLITYMRTDSVNVAREAQAQALDFIAKHYGKEYAPAKPNFYRSRKSAQEAHEAIRPTDVNHTPDSVAPYLTPQQAKIYRLIWNRFVASQMVPAQQLDHVIEIESTGGPLTAMTADNLIQDDAPASKKAVAAAKGIACLFHATARETLFPGYLAVYNIKEVGEEDDPDDNARALPDLKVGMRCDLLELTKEQCFTKPPNRYSEAALVKALEQNGVGRPSTYASTVNTIQEREYVTKDKGSLIPTELGFATNDFLVQHMPHLFDIGFTAQMEDELDQIEEGNLNWVSMIAEFYKKLQSALSANASASASQGCTLENLQAILALFPTDFPFAPPVKRGRRTYDDAKFFTSIADQAEAEKALSERQWSAILNLVAKYGAKSPAIIAAMDEIGLGDTVRQYIEEQEKASQEEPPPPPPPEQLKLLEAMTKVTWNEPVKRGKRVFDDGKFFRSLHKQVQDGVTLSPAQVAALLKLASKYAATIPDYEKLTQALGGVEPAANEDNTTPVATISEADRQKINALVAMAAEIKTWKTPKPGGRRTFNDKDFVHSVTSQYKQKGSLSERQVAALAKVIAKYSEQISDYASRAKDAGIGEPPPPPKLLEEKCPQCGAPLIARTSRGKSFTGCSAFPKCRYIAK